MVTVVLLVAGGLATPVTGLLIRPDVRWARHGIEGFVDLGRYAWYGYVGLSVLVAAAGVAGVLAAAPAGRRRAIAAAGILTRLTVVLGAIHVWVVATGVAHGKPLLAAVAGLVVAAAVAALVEVRKRLRRA